MAIFTTFFAKEMVTYSAAYVTRIQIFHKKRSCSLGLGTMNEPRHAFDQFSIIFIKRFFVQVLLDQRALYYLFSVVAGSNNSFTLKNTFYLKRDVHFKTTDSKEMLAIHYNGFIHRKFFLANQAGLLYFLDNCNLVLDCFQVLRIYHLKLFMLLLAVWLAAYASIVFTGSKDV